VQAGFAGVEPLYAHEWVDEKTIICGSRDGCLLVWDIRMAAFILEQTRCIPGLETVGTLLRAPPSLWAQGGGTPVVAAMGRGCAALKWG
jgi:hypothetical protein